MTYVSPEKLAKFKELQDSFNEDKFLQKTDAESTYVKKATTLAGYGITDAKINSGTITLGTNTITPLVSTSTLDATKLSGTIPATCYTDTVTTATDSGSGNGVASITANNGALTVTKATFLVASDIEGKAPIASPTFTGIPTAPTADKNTNTTQIATTAFVVSEIADKLSTADAMVFKGTVNKAADLPTTHEAGWTYKVATAGTYISKNCEIGDLIICTADGTTSNDAHWTIVQNNIDGAVTGPTSATANAIATFSGTTGKIIQNSAKTIATTLTTTSDTQVPTSKAVATYVTGLGYKTTDHIATTTDSGTGNGVASVVADVNGAITVTKATFLVASDIAGKQDTIDDLETIRSNASIGASLKAKVEGIQEGATATSFTRTLTSGTKIGTITINGQGTDIYCSTPASECTEAEITALFTPQA